MSAMLRMRSSVSRVGWIARRYALTTSHFDGPSTCSVFFRPNSWTSRSNSKVGAEMQRRLDDVKPGSLPKYITEKMHRSLRSIIPRNYLYARPVGLSFDLITSHLIDKYENLETQEKKFDFIEGMTNLELQRMLVLVGQKHPNKPEPTDFLDNLIMECCRRFKDWDARTLLYTCDILYQIDCDPKLFYRRLISHVSAQWADLKMTSSEILQLLFYMADLGETSEQLMLKVEKALTDNVQEFGMEALSLICSAFFIVNRRVKSPELVDWIAKSVLDEFDNLPRHQVNSALKVLRHASYQNPKLFNALGEKYYDLYQDKLSVSLLRELMEPMRCYASLRIYNNHLLSLVCDTFKELQKNNLPLDDIRSKDFSYLLWALAVFGHWPDKATLDYLADWLRTLQARGEFNTYPESMVNSVMAFVLMEYFPEDLMSLTLQSKALYRIKALRHMDKYYHLLIIDATSTIECQDYKGYQLPKGFISDVPKSTLGKINTELEGRAGLHAIYSALKDKFQDNELLQCHFILPHFHTASIEIHLDEENRPMKLPYQDLQRDFVSIYEKLLKRNNHRRQSGSVAVTDQLLKGLRGENHGAGDQEDKVENYIKKPTRRIAIEILGWHQVCYNDQERQLVTSEIKQRHLKKLGYEVLLIHPEEAHSMQDYNMEYLYKYAEEKIIKTLNINV